MACVPRIDQPCPLSRAEQRSLDGWCGVCRKTVHALDGMDDAARRRLLQRAAGPVCVSYRAPLALGAAALALALVAAPAPTIAQGLPAVDAPAALPGTGGAAPQGPQSSVTTAAETTPECEEEFLEEIWVGGVSAPGDAEWLEQDRSLPELPMRDVASIDGANL